VSEVGNIGSLRETIQSIKDLPTLPTVLIKIISETSNPDASALDLAKHIAVDQSLSASLLRLVNSAYFGFYRRISSVLDAVVLLGFVQVRDTLLAASAFKSLHSPDSLIDRVQLWRHSIASAMIADRISRIKRLKPQGTYYTAGLLHDIGKIVLDIASPRAYGEIVKTARVNGKMVCAVEQETLGFTHAQVGAALGEHWNLPADVVLSFGYHHNPENAPEEVSMLAHGITLADYIAYRAGMGETSNGKVPDQPEFSLSFLGLTTEDCDRIAESVAETGDRVDAMLGVLSEQQ